LTGRAWCSNWRVRWLRDHDPGPSREVTLVAWRLPPWQSHHRPPTACAPCWTGSWRIHGDPMEDLGWICVNSWRFGEIDRPVGGFGTREELFAGYEAAGGRSMHRASTSGK